MHSIRKKTYAISLIGAPNNSGQTQLGMYYLQAYLLRYLPKNSINISIFRLKPVRKKNIINHEYPDYSYADTKRLAARITRQKPTIVGLSCYVWNVSVMLKLGSLLKKNLPATKIVLGGPEVSYRAKELMKRYRFIDYIVIDEGEEPFLRLIQLLIFSRGNIAEIGGVCSRTRERIILKPPGKPVDLSRIPSPYLMGLINVKKEREIYIETSRGCPFKCAYCSYNIRNFNRMRFFPLKKVQKDLNKILSQPIGTLNIIDDNFNINPPRARTILKTILRFRPNTKVVIFLRADVWKLDRELLLIFSKLKILLIIGVQSLNPSTLLTAKRLHDRQALEYNLTELDRHRIDYVLQFIIGLPGDTYSDIKNNVDWSLRFNPKKITLQPLRIIPETFFQKNASRFRLKFRHVPPYTIFRSNTMPNQEIRKSLNLKRKLDILINNRRVRSSILKDAFRSGMKISEYLERWPAIMSP